MKEPTRKVETVVTITLDLRGEREFALPGLAHHKIVEVAWLTKSTDSHPVQAKAIRTRDGAPFTPTLSLRFAELPEEIKATLLRNMHVGDAPSAAPGPWLGMNKEAMRDNGLID